MNTYTHMNKKKNLHTTNLVPSIFFYRRKISLLFFSAPMKIFLKHVFFETMQSPSGFNSPRRLFLTFGNLTVIKYKSSSKRKKFNFFLKKQFFFLIQETKNTTVTTWFRNVVVILLLSS